MTHAPGGLNLDAWASGRPVLQIATDGWWEDATVVPVTAWRSAVTSAATEAASSGAEDLALEVLWPGPPVVFVGARYRPGDPVPLIPPPLETPWLPSAVLRILDGSSRPSVTKAELGVVNRWKSCGPLSIPLETSDRGLGRLAAHRLDLVSSGDPVAIEVTSMGIREFWWAVQVSVAEDEAGELTVRPSLADLLPETAVAADTRGH